MTPELERRWRAGEAPFDGRAVVTCDDPELSDLLGMLRFAAEMLEQDYGALLSYRDWHEHDGYLTSSQPFEWSSLSASLRSTEGLYTNRDGDDCVRTAIYPPTFEWILRFNIDDADSGVPAEAWCSFDFSSTPESRAAALVDAIHSRWPGYTDVVSAREYFDHSYAG